MRTLLLAAALPAAMAVALPVATAVLGGPASASTLLALGGDTAPHEAPASRPAPLPRRVISLVPAATEMLFAVGMGPQVVAVSSYDDFPPEVAALPRVGALLDPDVERILSLAPDLVVLYGSQADLQTQLEAAGIGVFSYRHGGLEAMFGTLEALGRLTGREADAQQLARRIRERIDRVRDGVRGRSRPRTLLVFGRDQGALRGLYVSGGRGFLHEMLEIAGGANVFADVQRESVQPSLETVLARAPEVVLELRATGLLAAGDVERERSAWSALPALPAVRARRVHLLEGDYLMVPGPRIADAVEAFARALHPDAHR